MLVNFDRPRPLFDPSKLTEYGLLPVIPDSPLREGDLRLGGLYDSMQSLIPGRATPTQVTQTYGGLEEEVARLRGEKDLAREGLLSGVRAKGRLEAPTPEKVKPVGQGQLNTGLLFGTLAAALGADQDVVLGAFNQYATGLQNINKQRAEEANQAKFTEYQNNVQRLEAQVEENRLLYGMTSDDIESTAKALQKYQDDANKLLEYSRGQVDKLTNTFLDLRAKSQLTPGILVSLQNSAARHGGSLVMDDTEWESVYHEATKNASNIDAKTFGELKKIENDLRADDDAHLQAVFDQELFPIKKSIELSKKASAEAQAKIDQAKSDPDRLKAENEKIIADARTAEARATEAEVAAKYAEQMGQAELAKILADIARIGRSNRGGSGGSSGPDRTDVALMSDVDQSISHIKGLDRKIAGYGTVPENKKWADAAEDAQDLARENMVRDIMAIRDPKKREQAKQSAIRRGAAKDNDFPQDKTIAPKGAFEGG